ncbi:hypothetical protein, partial [uncultured Roseobacter sp.]|uniref:hypothetical protein n=1 Tax=uncultured Roseobacter sp. TaxID=114847 RepID=UPI00260767A9
GAGGQIFIRAARDNWHMLTDAVLFDPKRELEEIRSAPDSDDPAYMDWLMASLEDNSNRNVQFFDMQGLSEDAIYICGVSPPGAKPVLCYWDGETLEELKVPLAEAALTGIYIESPDDV